MSDQDLHARLDTLEREYRYLITDMICRAGSGHIGGALSILQIIITLYHRILRIDPKNPGWAERDRFILSKGHAGPALYVTLADKGYFPKEWLGQLNKNGTRLPSHVDQIRTPGVDITAGSLGQGISCACGVALAGRMDDKDYTTYCIIGDGESNEGQVWEAALFAAHQKLDKLVVICDYNKFQIDGSTRDILSLDPLAEKWRSFGWEVFEMNGHDWDEIHDTLERAKAVRGKPSMIMAHTIKAKGHPTFENQLGSHNIRIPDAKTHQDVLNALGYHIALPY